MASSTRVCWGHTPRVVTTKDYSTQSAAFRAATNVVRGCERRNQFVHSVQVDSDFDGDQIIWWANIIHDQDPF